MEALARSAVWESEDATSSVALWWHRSDMVAIRWTGHIGLDSLTYFDELAAMLRGAEHPVHLLYDMLPMVSFDRAIVARHGAFSTEHDERIGRIAVATSMARVRFAIATVLMLQKKTVRGFSTVDEAEQWLDSGKR